MPERLDSGTPPETGEPQKEAEDRQIIENVAFIKEIKRGGGFQYKSSAPDRKIIILLDASLEPAGGETYRILVVRDTKPDDPKGGILYGRILIEEEQMTGLAEEVSQAYEEGELDAVIQKLKQLKAGI